MSQIPRHIRTGQGPVYVEADGHSLEQGIVKITAEVYSLVIRHVKKSGRTHPHPWDFKNAMKTVLLPSFSKREKMEKIMSGVTHIEDSEQISTENRGNTLDKLSDSARLMAGAEHVAEQTRKQRQRTREVERKVAAPGESLFPTTTVTTEQTSGVMSALSQMFLLTEMPDEAHEEFCFCSDTTQAEDNDMYLMAQVDELWYAYMQEIEETRPHQSQIEQTLIASVRVADAAYKASEAIARQRYEEECVDAQCVDQEEAEDFSE